MGTEGTASAAAAPGSAAPKISGLAVASLVCGILALPTCGLGGIAGLVLGIIGLSKINKSQGALKGAGLCIAGIALSGAFLVLSLLVMPALLMPALARSREEARKVSCINNLRQMGLVIQMYANDKGEAPAKLQDLYPQFVDDKDVFVCPADSEPATTEKGLKCSYEYVGRHRLSELKPDTIVAYDKPGNHRGGRNVLFGDGRVQWLDESDFEARLGSAGGK